jgi:ribosome biogenesis GTPase / thiamine phosphate phosphatase
VFKLEDLGWGPFFQQQLNSGDLPGLAPARVMEEFKGAYRVVAEAGEFAATMSGRLRHEALSRGALPAAGDWVLVARIDAGGAVIQRVLERRTKLSRKTASGAERRSGGRSEEQILAANVDTAFVVAALNRDYNPRRLERYLAAVWESGARPVVVLNKADLHSEVRRMVREAEALSVGVEVIASSTLTGDGIGDIRSVLKPGETAVLVGSSGVGKSSLINCLLDDNALTVRGLRSDGRGRHTTTSRQLLLLPGGCIVIDTPGLREFTLWDADDGLDRAFADISSFARECAFRDCRHVSEPGCAVREAITEGALPEERFASYRKLEREREFTARRQDKALEIAEKKRWKRIHVANRQRMRLRGR